MVLVNPSSVTHNVLRDISLGESGAPPMVPNFLLVEVREAWPAPLPCPSLGQAVGLGSLLVSPDVAGTQWAEPNSVLARSPSSDPSPALAPAKAPATLPFLI